MFELEVFRKQMYCTEESTCTLSGLFSAHRNHSAPLAVIRRPGNCAPVVTPLVPCFFKQSSSIRNVFHFLSRQKCRAKLFPHALLLLGNVVRDSDNFLRFFIFT